MVSQSPAASGAPDGSPIDRWAASGAMALTGRVDGPGLGPPEGLVARLDVVASRLAELSGRIGTAVHIDPLGLLGERAAIAGLRAQGTVSCGGYCRLLRASDGWLAVSLARPDDLDLLDAWLGTSSQADPWERVAACVSVGRVDALSSWGAELGLAVATLPHGLHPMGANDRGSLDTQTRAAPLRAAPEVTDRGRTDTAGGFELPRRARRLGDADRTVDMGSLVVADLSGLWAGPLCGALLALAGAEVWKVESRSRPDGARSGPQHFFDLMNADKASVALDLGSEQGGQTLQRVLAAADVVIEASRPRALDQLGIDREDLLGHARPRVWVTITAHGAGRNQIGFGDDIAVGGGLVATDDEGPVFCADAIADPLSGMVAATAILDALAQGGAWLIDVDMHGVAAAFAGATLPVPDGVRAAPPQARTPTGSAPPLGADTASVLAEVGRRLGMG